MTEPSALATAAAVRSGETTALAEAEAAIARIEARDGALNAVVVRDFDRARAAAAELDRRIADGFDAPLLGAPMTVKESFDVAGLPTTWGLVEHRDFVPARDAESVRRLKRAGAVILGKTNVAPALADLQSTNAVYGRTNNPHDPARVCGGSSGGSGAALGSGMVPIELGSDIAGSIRIPAHFCGVWGLKPTYGALSREGQSWPGTDGDPGPLSVIGPMARDADDLAAMLDVLSDVPLPPAEPRTARDLSVLLVTSHPVAPADAVTIAAVAAVGDVLERAGARVSRDASALPDLAGQYAGYMRLLLVTLARGEPSSQASATLPDWFAMRDDQARAIRAWRRVFSQHHAVVAPILGGVAFPHSDVALGERLLAIDGVDTPFALQFGWPALATYPNLPATAVPVAAHEGLPIGVQVIGDLNRDHDTIAVARIVHDLLGAST